MLNNFSGKFIKRLTTYHYIINNELAHNCQTVSSARISSLLKIDGSQVRRDLAHCGIHGKTNVGYKALELRGAIEHLLGFSEPKRAFIIGAGNLGLALGKFNDFRDYGVEVVALLDNDPQKVDLIVAGKTVFHLAQLNRLATEMAVTIAFLTVPGRVAQKTADLLVGAGIKYIWNFSPVIITVPEGVKVRTENLIGSFLDFINN